MDSTNKRGGYFQRNLFNPLLNIFGSKPEEVIFNAQDKSTPLKNKSANSNIIVIGAQPEVINLENDGYSKAKANDGNTDALKIQLSQIVEGKKVEAGGKTTINEDEKNVFKTKILDFENEIRKSESEITEVIETNISDAENKMRELKDEINGIITNNNPLYLLGKTFNKGRAVVSSIFLFFLTFYVYIFYFSAIHAAFFRNISLELEHANGSTDNMASLTNTIFSPNIFQDVGNEIYFLAFAPALFFGFAYCLHLVFGETGRRKYILMAILMSLTLFSDSLVAYKIDKSINDILSYVTLTNTGWVWYKSVNFYIVLVMGFIAVCLWGIILHYCLKEYQKRDISGLKNEEIKIRENKLGELGRTIQDLRSQTENKRNSIANSRNSINQLNTLLNANTITVETVLLSIDSFASGWIRFLNEKRDNQEKTSECFQIVAEAKQSVNSNL
jgi:hypothetical protein